MNDLKTYMSHAVLIALHERKNEDFSHLMQPMLKARKSLATSSRSLVMAADRRITVAVAQLLDNAPPPPAATLPANGHAAVEADRTAEQLVAEYRPRLTDWDRKDWRAPIAAALDRRVEALQRKAAKAREAKAAARAEELASRGVPFDLPAHDGDGPPLRWLGGWRDGRDYKVGSVVSRSDSLWVCSAPCRGVEPGKERGGPDEPRAWRILLKTPDLRPAAKNRK
jgi:hypothetical protein